MQNNYQNYNVVAIHNIDEEDFRFEYDRSSGNYPYVIPSGEIRRFPKFIAQHALKHLIDKILTKRKIKTNNQPARDALAEQIVVEEEKYSQDAQPSEAEIRKEEFERLNSETELESVLKRNKERIDEVAARRAPAPTPEPPKADPEENFEGLKVKESKPATEEVLKGDELDTTDEDVPPKEAPKVSPVLLKKEAPSVLPMPTRTEIYEYGKRLGLVIDDKTQKTLDKMTVAAVMQEIGDPREALA